MNYHNITHDDMNNGNGLRVVLWLSGCSHHCYNCQNPQTWNPESGILFDENAQQEIFDELSKDYISGITFSGGDPLYEENLDEVLDLVSEICELYPDKTIWLYTGYSVKLTSYSYIDAKNEYKQKTAPIFTTETPSKNAINNFKRAAILSNVDVIVDGEYKDDLRDVTLKWRGSSNQRVIDVQESIKQNKVVLYCD